MSRLIILMASESMRDNDRKREALQSDALVQVAKDANLVDLHDVTLQRGQTWSEWWFATLSAADETVLVLIPDANGVLGFRQHQRATYARKLHAPVYVLQTGTDGALALTPFDRLDIRPTEPRTLARFAKITGG